jgi:hypothetical protein
MKFPPTRAYNDDVYVPPSIKYWLHQIKLARTNLQTQYVRGRPLLDDVDAEMVLTDKRLAFEMANLTSVDRRDSRTHLDCES